MVKLLFKTPTKQQPITLEVNLGVTRTVEQLKQQVASKANSTVPNIKLIHKGKILKDETPLETLKLIEGETFHAVIKAPENANNSTTSAQQPTASNSTGSTNPQSATDPFGGLGGMGGLGGFGGMGGMGGSGGLGGLGGMGGMGGLGGMDPQAMASMMDMITPEMMQQMVNSNPMLKSMADSNPQVKAMISNPQLMKQMLSQVNPAQMQAAMSQMGGLGGMGGMGGMGGLGGYGGLGGMGGFGGLGGLGGTGTTGTSATTNLNSNVDYKTLFAQQLTQLQGMGFTNEATNIQVLKQTAGNVQAAVERLLNMLG